MENSEKKPMTKKKKIILIVVGALLAVILVALIAGIVIYNNMLNRISRFDAATPTVEATVDPAATEATEETVPPTTINPYDFEVMFPGEEPIGGEIINIMLVGQDTRNAELRGLSDTMILVSINPATKKIVLTSFIRDLYTNIVCLGGTGTYKDRLNTAYCTGGIDQLGDTLAYNFGVEIDNFVEVNFKAFRKIVNILGGLDVELTETEAWYLNKECGYELVVGMNHLDGKQTLNYARIRAIDNDFNRTARQRYVLTELLKKVKTLSIKEMIELAEEFLPMVTTDMTNLEITKYIIQIAPMLKDLELESLRVPVDGTWGGKNVGTEEAPKYVIDCFDNETNRDMIKNAIYDIEEATE